MSIGRGVGGAGAHGGALSLDQEVGAPDAVLLDPLSEEAFIANLHQRFKRDQIYTYIGPVAVSVNPYKKLALYTPEVINAYRKSSIYELPPHIYGTADTAYRCMRDRSFDQCIMITGESGSGKTEATKCILQYVAEVSGRWKEVTAIKEYLLQAQPLLEAFGNAKTIRNDNSSRFGKYLDIEFDFKGDPVGGVVTHYLLEKYRIVNQAQGERNFHIFYQMLSGADVHLLKSLKLQRNLENYMILRQSRSMQADSIDDRSAFLVTKRSMETLGFSQDELSAAFQIVSVVLKLGNAQFQPRANMDGTEGCTLMNEYEVYDVCDLLKGDFAQLHSALTQRVVDSRHETVIADLSASEATYTRDALCKALYSRLFTWIVNRINETIRAKRMGKRKYIGILDIYGFEVFEHNNFEQLIINYCNEKLQNVLIELTLKSEQEEYLREGVNWINIEYFNNAVICDLIEKNNHGVLAMLDEECMRSGVHNDEAFLFKLTQACQDNPYFEARGSRNFVMDSTLPHHCFRLRHYAGAVTYTVPGFLEKNNDALCRDLSQAMFHCDHPLTKTLFPEGNPKRTTVKRPATVCSQFRVSVSALMKSLQAKQPNFVRCVKPNELKQPMIFEMALVQHQVRYLGLLEMTKVRRSGYAFRQDYESFLQRFKMLSLHTWPFWPGIPIEGVTHLLRDLPIHPQEYAFGRTKVFIKHSRTVYELEEFRHERLNELATLIQKTWRGWVLRKFFLRVRNSQTCIANNFRCWKSQLAGNETTRRALAAALLRNTYLTFKRRNYLLWLARHLPDESPISHDWPPSPWCLHETSHLLRKLFHKWRCGKYRHHFDQTARNRMREKVTSSYIFKDKKASYPKSVSHPFRGDYLRLRQNTRWKKLATETGDQYVVFADIINKITRSSGKCVQNLFVISTCSIMILDQRTMQVKYRIPASDIGRISLSPLMDDIAVFHVRSNSDATKKKGDFLFETGHVIEIVTKLYLVIQNALGKPPEINISSEFEAVFNKESVLMSFKTSGQAEVQPGQVRINRRGNRMEIIV